MSDHAPEPSTESSTAGQVDEPDRLLCPITQIMFRDPCFVPESGNTYEADAVERYWATLSQPRDPLTNQELQSRALHTNWGVRREVQVFLDSNPGYLPQGWTSRPLPPPNANRDRRGHQSTFGWLPIVAKKAHVCAGFVLLLALAVGYCMLPANEADGWTMDLPRFGENGTTQELEPPRGSNLRAFITGNLTIRKTPRLQDIQWETLLFGIFWCAFCGAWTVGAARASYLFALFSTPFWCAGLFMLWQSTGTAFTTETLTMGKESYEVSSRFLCFPWRPIRGRVADLSGLPRAECTEGKCTLTFQDGTLSFNFGNSLHEAEVKWILGVLEKHLTSVTGDSRFKRRSQQITHKRVHHDESMHSRGMSRRRHGGGFGMDFGPQFGIAIR
mmetsp:Transcript_52978/g.119119  ORF Transcript_52978/g.119119 Transcript_52978/m.119119 type:complete len:387 (+) Transcript_52978:96-1256(+)